MNLRVTNRGVSAVEVLVGVSIAALILVAVTFTITQFVNASQEVADKTQALYLAEEGLELVRFIRDNDWADIDALTVGATNYLDIQPADILTTATPEVIGKFTRSFVLEEVERNGDDDIVASGSVDTGSKYITVSVSWGTPVQTVELTSLLTDFNP